MPKLHKKIICKCCECDNYGLISVKVARLFGFDGYVGDIGYCFDLHKKASEFGILEDCKLEDAEKSLKERVKMREIEFKAWQKNGNGVTFFSLFGINPPLEKDDFIAICEWTGLYDRNGNEIYEGDLICCFNQSSVAVIFVNGAFGYELGSHDYVTFANNYYFDWKDGKSERIEVVGSVYEAESKRVSWVIKGALSAQ